MKQRHKLSPYMDVPLLGRVSATFVRGQLVFSADQKKDVSSRACGRAFGRPEAVQGGYFIKS